MSQDQKIPTRHVVVGLVFSILLGLSTGMATLSMKIAHPAVAVLVGVVTGCFSVYGWLTGAWRSNIPKGNAEHKTAP